MLTFMLFTGDVSKAKFLKDRMTKLGCRLEDDVIASLIGLYGKQQKLKEAQDVFQEVAGSSKPGKSIIKSIIDAYARCGKAMEAYLIYEEVTAQGHHLDAVAMSILVNTLTNCGMTATVNYFVPLFFFFLTICWDQWNSGVMVT